MKRHVGVRGFTIVETMVVLAVTGGLFVLIAFTLSGRQRSNEFTQAINDARSTIQQAITQAQQGNYPSQGDFSCTKSGASVLIAKASVGQGENNDCVFLGTLFQFNEGGTNPSLMRVYPVAGLRTASSIATADPSVVRNSAGGALAVDASTKIQLKYGLTFSGMTAAGPGSIGAFAILSSLDSTTAGESGDQQFDIYAVGISPSSSVLTDSSPASLPLTKNPTGGIVLCLQSGGTDQWGRIVIGNNSNKLSVELEVKNGTPPSPCS